MVPALNEWMVRSLSEKLVHIYENTPTNHATLRITPHATCCCRGLVLQTVNIPMSCLWKTQNEFAQWIHVLRHSTPTTDCCPRSGPSEMVQTRPRCSSKQVSQCPIATAQNGMNPVYSIYKYYSILLLYIYTTTLYSLFFTLFKYVSQKRTKKANIL